MQCCAAVPASGEEVGIPVSEPAHRPVPDPAHPAVEQGGLAQHRRHVPALPQHQLNNSQSGVTTDYSAPAVWAAAGRSRTVGADCGWEGSRRSG